MNRKWMALLLSLLLVMMLPLSALADRQHTLTVVPGELIGSQQAVVDLLNVLDLRLTEGDRSGALTIMLNDQDIATLGLTVDTTGLYVSSNIIGADVLYVTWEDGFAFLTDQVMIRLTRQRCRRLRLRWKMRRQLSLPESALALLWLLSQLLLLPLKKAWPWLRKCSLMMTRWLPISRASMKIFR